MFSESLLLKLARKHRVSLEAFVQSAQNTSFLAKGGHVEARDHSRSHGFAVRVIAGKKLGFASFEKEGELEPAVVRALASAKAQASADYAFPSGVHADSRAYFDARSENVPDSEFVDSVEEMVRGIAKTKSRCIQAGLSVALESQELWNSEGTLIRQKFSKFSALAHAAYKDSEADDGNSSNSYGLDLGGLARNAGTWAKGMQGSKKIAPGTYPVIFDVRALQSLLSLYFPFHFDGESHRKKLSKLSPGAPLLPAGISIYDDPSLPEGEHSAAFDDEGFAMRRQALVSKGKVAHFLYDLTTAAKSGVSGGNGVRASYEAPPHASFSNLVIEGGTVGDAVAECKNGLYVNSFLTSGSNALTGDFTFPLLVAFRIRKGEITHGVRGAMFSGNVFDVLKTARFEKRPEYRIGIKSGRMVADLKIVSG